MRKAFLLLLLIIVTSVACAPSQLQNDNQDTDTAPAVILTQTPTSPPPTPTSTAIPPPPLNVLFAKPGAIGDCRSWGNACDLRIALSVAQPGEEIWAATGIYIPGTAMTDTFTLRDGVAMYGGFAGTETSRDQREWDINITVLSGDIDNLETVISDVDLVYGLYGLKIDGNNAYHVVTGSGTDHTAVLDGFQIIAGYANDYNPDNLWTGVGGGFYSIGGSPTLTNVTFMGNRAWFGGGAMYNGENSSPTLTNVGFWSNHADYFGGGAMFNRANSNPVMMSVIFWKNSADAGGGGGMHNLGSSPVMTGVFFEGNYASHFGGGMYNEDSDPMITNATFEGNGAVNGSEGIYNYYSSPTFTNVILMNNWAAQGGGIYNSYGSPIVTNATFFGNEAVSGAIYNENDSRPTIANCIIWGNTFNDKQTNQISNYDSTPVISYSDIQGSGGSGPGWDATLGNDGGGNIDTDPFFVDPNGLHPDYQGFVPLEDRINTDPFCLEPTSGNLQLRSNSPAVDAGNNSALPSGAITDLGYHPRIVGNRVDMGAYEVQR